jgi:[acyl-carrier-protein] S-malonyltransferase
MSFAITFPGQGSQSVAMFDSYPHFPGIDTTLQEASDILSLDFKTLIKEGPAEELARTVNTQPVMLVAGVAIWRAWKMLGGAQPLMFAGHSLGEYTALVAAGSLSFADALRLVRLRAEAMQAAVPEGQGAIAAILGLDAEAVAAACSEAELAEDGAVVEIANLNAPGQIVISGHRSAVERAITIAKAKGAKRAVLLPMSVPAHCSLMAPAAAALAAALAEVDLQMPTVPVIHNATAQVATDVGAIRHVLCAQVFSPVRWIECVTAIEAAGAKAFIEVGPGKVLTGLNSRIAKNATAYSTQLGSDLEVAIAHVKTL